MIAETFVILIGLLVQRAVTAATVPKPDIGYGCGVHMPTEEQLELHRNLSIMEENNMDIDKRAPIYVDTYFHVVVDKEEERVKAGRTVLKKQLAVINIGFAPAKIFFNLRAIDWTVNPRWAIGLDVLTMKYQLHRGGRSSLNLYFISALPDVPGEKSKKKHLGICSFPDEVGRESEVVLDGCLVDVDTIPGGAWIPYDDGKTAIHEIGHWFGLLHTFQGGCDGSGDMVSDTPASASASVGCPEGRNSCPDLPGLDPIHNYMDYSNESVLCLAAEY
ncbi:hypothetical protein QQS21_004569 [Conoideocrella luteorostrata]|uniref:Peptidase M43 pregnancy-associated plasma-A domain-containing protein n=1 Tax=Conoideocrella luteorostrata TaxID=1105319 RepID=A0AAJ0CR51_9HYPO|nr:hypothetical protein QQS21_004569 [Conoideocrella luteorostrata]